MLEEAIVIHWTEYLEQSDGDPVSLGDIAQFMSGSSKVPASGFNCQPSIKFTDVICLPKTSTCDVSITFPCSYGLLDYDTLKKRLMNPFATVLDLEQYERQIVCMHNL